MFTEPLLFYNSSSLSLKLPQKILKRQQKYTHNVNIYADFMKIVILGALLNSKVHPLNYHCLTVFLNLALGLPSKVSSLGKVFSF